MPVEDKLRILSQLQGLESQDLQSKALRQRVGFEEQREPLNLQALQQGLDVGQAREDRDASRHPVDIERLKQEIALNQSREGREAISAPIRDLATQQGNERAQALAPFAQRDVESRGVDQTIRNAANLRDFTKDASIRQFLKGQEIEGLDAFAQLPQLSRQQFMVELAKTGVVTPEMEQAASIDDQLAAFISQQRR